MSIRGRILAAATAVTLFGAASASANTVDLDYQTNWAFGSPAWAEKVHRTIDGTEKHVWSGLFRLTDGVQDILAFCIEPNVWLKINEDYSTSATAATDAQLLNIDKLYTSAYDQVNSKATAAGFQLALWEIMVETGTQNGFDLATGNHTVRASSEALAAGNLFLAGIATAGSGGYDLTTYVNSGQNLVSGVTAVPLPASLWLSVCAIAGLISARRRKLA